MEKIPEEIMKGLFKFLCAIVILSITSCSAVKAPEPVGPVPSQRQLDWHELEYYAFVHFNMNTFTDKEWGLGGEAPLTFYPLAFDARQWARVAKEAGMKGIIITAKHHDGFCLWPTETTSHSVKNSLWNDGEGDVIKELSEACKEYGLKMGVYLSPWDRNHPEYGREEYVKVFHKQLEELLTNYGEIFEVWFDGANGGTGYYGGANENRKIDHRTYYQWDKVLKLVRRHQPNAVIFSDNGPDVRWVGNEHGFAGETNWSIIKRDEVFSGSGRHEELQYGHQDGTHWIPAEADVSIRPGWYYHSRENHLVKSLPELVDIYYNSIGRNASLLLNLPVDNRGLVHQNDVKQLMKLREQLDKDFKHDLAPFTKVQASSTKSKFSRYAGSNVTDGKTNTYWAPQDNRAGASLLLEFLEPTTFNRFLVQEYIPLGQRVKEFSLEARVKSQWIEIASQTTIGYKRILRFAPVTASAIRLNIKDSKDIPLISNIEVYNAPALLISPEINRTREGEIEITVPSIDNIQIWYTTDGSEPDKKALFYSKPFVNTDPVVIKAVAYDPVLGEYSAIEEKNFDILKKDWKLIGIDPDGAEEATKVIDDDISSSWVSKETQDLPQEITVDIGEEVILTGFTYYPPKGRDSGKTISHYELLLSSDNENWTKVAEGEFGNIRNNPVQQEIHFSPQTGRFIKLIGTKTIDASPVIGIAELGVITRKELKESTAE